MDFPFLGWYGRADRTLLKKAFHPQNLLSLVALQMPTNMQPCWLYLRKNNHREQESHIRIT
jgi:hypothetical protein